MLAAASQRLMLGRVRIHLPCVAREDKHLIGCTRASFSKMDSTKSTGKVTLHVEKVAGHTTELLKFHSEAPFLQIVFIPGNPGVISFYQTFIEALSEHFNGRATITAIGHLAQTEKDLDSGKLFSLQDQIDHKVQFIESHYSDTKLPLVLVGHSIGAYISTCIFKESPEKVQYVVGLYPFLAINTKSSFQALLRWFAGKKMFHEILGYLAGFVGKLPDPLSRSLVSGIIGHGWSPFSVNVACRYILQYHSIRNFCYMGMTEFQKLQKHPDWAFLKEKQDQISLLFGVDDHWGPLTLFEEVSMEAPDLDVEIEREGHKHSFCCSEAGSYWVAAYCTKVIMKALSFEKLISQL